MQVKQGNAGFQPITIVLESKEEAMALKTILNHSSALYQRDNPLDHLSREVADRMEAVSYKLWQGLYDSEVEEYGR